MRRDLCYFYPIPVQPVFDAFVQAARQKFGKNCKIDAYKMLSFGLDYSFRYNMNGGSLTIHFMPYNNGTAIDMHYTVVQAFGARYQKHADDVLIFVNAALGAQAQPINISINEFLAYETGVPSAPLNAAPQPQQVAQPVQQTAQSAPQAKFCMNCGAPIAPNTAFCTNCGKKLNG
ncbi:MAG: zinc ribbon domain-containing protein [Ruminococcus sp.]|uniref:zinc ribbon domain-containing protein n=1 Tax=Ruminococcus sp. TaxID=41978 RepID=UPI0028730B6E|nr:zinc ribbon domain-containing protein [Ruminococcus sp.]MBQ3284672.1 zinc ribbon domain-containing protein [Ruminococcus sp.]